MDQPGADKAALLKELRDTFGDGCVDFSEEAAEDFEENIGLEFNRIPYDSSIKMDDELMDLLEPFDYKEIKEFDMDLIIDLSVKKF